VNPLSSRAALGTLLVAMAAAVAPPAGAAPAPPPPQAVVPLPDTTNGCLSCHADKREAATEGVHSQHGMTCVDCHGGTPSATTLPAAHRGKFSGHLDKVATARLCGSCHSDPDQMRQYGLPTGQLAQFRASRHGQLLFGQNNQDVPTCSNCHGSHIIYPPYDARSPVYPTNSAETCAHCHSDQQLMSRYDLPTNQFDEFRHSAHGVALYEDQNFAAPSCVGCHGAHSELPPDVTQIANVCGRCHVLVAQQFAAGPHGAAARAGKLEGCLGCHGNHDTERVPADSIAATCDQCHASQTNIHQLGVDLQRTVVQSRSDMQSARNAVDEMASAGERVSYDRFRYRSALTYYLQIAQKQHRLDMDTLEDLSRRVRSVSVALDADAQASHESRWEQKLLLLPVWFLALSAMALAALAWRKLRRGGPEED